MEDNKDFLQVFKLGGLNENKMRIIIQTVSQCDTESLVEISSSTAVTENNSTLIQTSDCSEAFSSSINASKTFSELPFSNNSEAHINVDEENNFAKTNSINLGSEDIADDSSKFIGFHEIEPSLKENAGEMNSDFSLEENHCQFEDNEFHSSSDIFNDSSFLNLLEYSSSSRVLSNPLILRNSLYRKFDPLYVNYFSQHNTPNEHLSNIKDEIDYKKETSPNTFSCNDVENEVRCNRSFRQPIGNFMISFDIPKTESNKISLPKNASVCDFQKLYTSEDLKKSLESKELELRGSFLRKQKDLEDLFIKRIEKLDAEVEKQKCLSNSLFIMLKEAMNLVNVVSDKKKSLELKVGEAEKDNVDSKENLDIFLSDFQNIEHIFSDFKTELEWSTSMLNLYLKNDNFMKLLENMNTELNDKEKIYKEFQCRYQKIMDKPNFNSRSPNKSAEF